MDETNNGQPVLSQEAACGGNTKISILPAVLSLFLPGLGQWSQRRCFAGIAFFLTFIWTLLFPFIAIVFDIWMHLPKDLAYEMLCGVVLCLFPLLVLVLAILDTILWQNNSKTHFRDSLATIFICVLPVTFVLFVPEFAAMPPAAYRMQCSNNIKQIALAIYNYHDSYGCFPPAYTTDKDGKPLHSWRVLLLPYLEEQTLYDKIRLDEPWDSEYNKQFHSQMPSIFHCPLSPTTGNFKSVKRKHNKVIKIPEGCSYSLVIGEQTAFPVNRSAADSNQRVIKFDDIKDGTSNTIILVERLVPVNWMEPDNDIPFEKACDRIDKRINGIGSMHPDGCNCGFADGSVWFIHNDIAPDELKAKLTINGGENSPPR